MNQLKAISLLGDAPKQRVGTSRVMFGAGKQNVLLNREVVGTFVTILHRSESHAIRCDTGCNRFAHVVKVNDSDRADTPKQ